MEIWAEAMTSLEDIDVTSNQSNTNINLELSILTNNTTIPVIITTKDGQIESSTNIPARIEDDPEKLQELLEKIKSQNQPIIMDDLGVEKAQYLYYGNSPIITKLKYFPISLIVIILLFVGVIYFFYATSKSSEQNKLWAGMAKETAHQIGTPLSSLVGWTEILKQEHVKPEYIIEIEKDIDRLKTITDRFSKIGSKPTLIEADVVRATQDSYDYLKARSSKLIEFSSSLPRNSIYVELNEPLFGWTLENIVKNGIDAMRGKGSLHIAVEEYDKWVSIQISDSGKGITKSNFTRVFKPGYTTKKRGWGLGLSLAKRIIEEYHDGRLRIVKSELNKGTTFEIRLKKS
ncbi:HAMP domain-containing sensor histidine kinase [Gangjinia marincola]|uniref:histidine kinase n=2 Tax=Gangjinia marincola TaxID=578463 RepID=A0ABP3XTM3_9FLAO